jgi:hypothetical protein
MTLLAARALTAFMEIGPRARRIALAGAVVVATTLLASFYVNYFHEFETSGGRSHRTFITAATEPKQLAFEDILATRRSGTPVMIVAQDWWQFWPIAYLARGRGDVEVRRDLTGEHDPAFAAALANSELYFVEFVKSPELAHARDWIRDRHLSSTETSVPDASGRTLFTIVKVSNSP